MKYLRNEWPKAIASNRSLLYAVNYNAEQDNTMIGQDKLGTLSVLNINDGDTKFTFNSDDPKEVERAKKCIQDMLKMGYMIFVTVGGKLKRVKRFNAKTCEYTITDKEPTSAKRTVTKRVSAKTHRTTAVPRTAGG